MMSYRVWPLLATLALVLPATLSAEEKYTIKVKESGVGARASYDSSTTGLMNTKIIDPDGKTLQDKNEKTVTTSKYTETILERAKGKRATKLRRAYEKFEIKVGDSATSPSFAGKTVLIEKQKDGKYHFVVEGGDELAGKDAEPLAKEFNRKTKADDPETMLKMMLPRTPVGLDEAWKVDAKKFAELLRSDDVPFDADKAQGSGKLVKAYKKNGHQFGVLAYHFDMPLKGELGSVGKKIPVQPGSKLIAQLKIDCCIDGSVSDGSSEFGFDTKILSTLKAGDMELKLIVNGKISEKKTERELPPEKK